MVEHAPIERGQGTVHNAGQQPVDADQQALHGADGVLGLGTENGGGNGAGRGLRCIGVHAHVLRHAVHGCGVERGPRVARRHIGDRDPAALELAAQGFREAAQAELAGAIDAETGKADTAHHRSHVDDPASAMRQHARQRGAAELDRRQQVGRDQRLDPLRRGKAEAAEIVDAGAVHQDVDPALHLRRLRDYPRRGPGNAEVGGDHGRAGGVRRQPIGQPPQPRRVARDQGQPAASSGQGAGGRGADTAAGAGQQDMRMRLGHGSAHAIDRKMSP